MESVHPLLKLVLDPRPTPETIHLTYQEYYTHTAPSKSSSQPLSLLRRWRRALANDYRNWRFGTAFQPANKMGRFAFALLPEQRQIGYIPQQIYLCDDTLRGNIAFGVPEPQIEEASVRTAVRTA